MLVASRDPAVSEAVNEWSAHVDLKMSLERTVCRVRTHHLLQEFPVLLHVGREFHVVRPEPDRIDLSPLEFHYGLACVLPVGVGTISVGSGADGVWEELP